MQTNNIYPTISLPPFRLLKFKVFPRFIDFFPSFSIQTNYAYPEYVRYTVHHPLYNVPDMLQFYNMLLLRHIFAHKKIQPIISNSTRVASTSISPLCASSCLVFLPVTPFFQRAKTKNAISQQLMGRFCSSCEESKPYPYASETVISNYSNTKLHVHIHCVLCIVLKLNTFFRELPLKVSLLSTFRI